MWWGGKGKEGIGEREGRRKKSENKGGEKGFRKWEREENVGRMNPSGKGGQGRGGKRESKIDEPSNGHSPIVSTSQKNSEYQKEEER